MSKGPRGKKSYEATTDALVILDRRQLTNGAIVPNYVIDLWLPIIEYCGLGVLTTLYRLASFDTTNGKARVILRQLARSGGMGFARLRKILDKFETLGFLKLHIPTGQARGNHFRTVIEIFDAPFEVPRKYEKTTRGRTYLKDVRSLTTTSWLIEQDQSEFTRENSPSSQVRTGEVPPVNSMEFTGENSMEVSGVNSMEFTGGTPIFKEPIRKEPTLWDTTRKEPTHARTSPPGRSSPPAGVCVSEFDYEVRKEYAAGHFSTNSKGERIRLGAGWLSDSRDGRYDDLIGDWVRTPAKIDAKKCPDCTGEGFVRALYLEGKGLVKCTHPKLRQSTGRELDAPP